MKTKALVVPIVLTGLLALILNYLLIPAFNLHSVEFWLFTLFILGVFTISLYATFYEEKPVIPKTASIIVAILVAIFFISVFVSGKLVNSKSYSKIIENNIVEKDFSTYEGTLNNVPLLDKDSALLIANRELGTLIDVVSQFEIDDSEQITVHGTPQRVSILKYGSFFKWVNNKRTGTPGYIKVDMQTQDAELVRVEGNIKYSPSEYFSRDLNRYLRKNFPTKIFAQSTLELDEEGHPYWLAPILDYTIGLFGGKDVVGAVTVDAVTGELMEYKVGDIPEWLDNVYPSHIIMQQYDYYGKFQSGFWNSKFGQRGVKVTTDGYNYIPLGDDNWIYTGVTSTGKDESNIGLILANKRTKEVIYYQVSGAEEYSAMASAEGVVQHLGYTSTFPLLLKVEGQPTYMVALKDAGGLVKMYGMVNVEKYQIVATGDTIASCQAKYRELLKSNGAEVAQAETNEINGIITDIKEATKEGSTYFYIELDNTGKYYVLGIIDNESVILLKVGDNVTLNSLSNKEESIIPALLYK